MATQQELLGLDDEDRVLVVAFQEGELDAFDDIVRGHYPSLLARARRRLGTIGDEAEDAVQETFLRAYRALDRFAGELHLGAWLNRILDNACADVGNRHSGDRRLRERLATRRGEEPETPEEVAGDPPLRALVEEAVAALPESYRAAFVLRELERRPYPEVAQAMAVSEENARARVHRARARLARALREVGAALGAFAFPARLAAWRRHLSGANAAPPAAASPGAVPGEGAPLGSLGSLASGAAPRGLAQVSASPLGQGLLASMPELSRNTVPVVGTALATLAAGAAAVLPTPAIAPTVAAPQHPALPGYAAGAPGLEPFGAASAPAPAPVAVQSTSTPRGTALSLAPGAGGGRGPSPADPSSSTTVTPAANPLLGPAAQWGWVAQAASSDASGGAAAAPGPTASNSPCPYAQAFPISAPGTPSVPPALPAGATPTGSVVTAPVTLAGTNNAFEIDADGQGTDGTATSPVETTIGACLAQVSSPMLVANVSGAAGGAGPGPVLQIEAAPVPGAGSAGGDVVYRGVGVWLSGPEAGSAPMALVAELSVSPLGIDGQAADPNAPPGANSPDEAVSLLVAFYGPVSDLLAPAAPSPPGCTGGEGAATNPAPATGGGAGPPSTTTTTSPPGGGAGTGGGPGCTAPEPPGATSTPPAEQSAAGGSS